MKSRAVCVLVSFAIAAPPSGSAADRFALIIDGLCRAIAASRTTCLPAPVMMLLWNRLRRTAARFVALAALVQAGALLPSRPRRRARSGSTKVETPAPPKPRLPTSFAWLIRLIPAVACSRSQLQHLLSDPEVDELFSAAPQFGRMLRPLCHMLGISPPESLDPIDRHRVATQHVRREPDPATNTESPARPPAIGQTAAPVQHARDPLPLLPSFLRASLRPKTA